MWTTEPGHGRSMRTEVCAVRLNRRQVDFMDSQRGNLTRSAWIRMLILAAERGGVPQPLSPDTPKP